MLAVQLCAHATEMARLRNGFSLRFDRKEQLGEVTRLYTQGGYVDVRTEEIASFERVEESAPAPAKPVVLPAPQGAMSQADIDQFVKEASARYRLDPDFVRSVIKIESDFRTRAVSRKGAQGLMQLMPETAARLGVSDAFDPKANVDAGTQYLSELLDRYHDDPVKALAAYNAGAHRVEQYKGVPPYRETRAYINAIVRDFNARKAQKEAASRVKKAASRQGAVTKAASPAL